MKAILICAVVLLAGTAGADLIYNVTFEDPPHVLDQPIVMGVGSDRPTETFGYLYARTGLGDFATQVASAESGSLDFNPETVFTAGVVRISWDLAMLQTQGEEPQQVVVNIVATAGDSPPSIYFIHYINGQIRLGSETVVGSYTLGEKDHFEVVMDMDSDRYDVLLNGAPLQTNQAMSSDWNPNRLGFNTGFMASPLYAVDNVVWEVVPEPSTNALLFLGGVGFALKRLYDKHIGR